MNAAEIAKHLHGKRAGGGSWLVRCPCHEDKSASLSIRDGRTQPLVVKCFAGCDPLDVKDQFRALGYLGPIEDARTYVPPKYATAPVDDKRTLQFIKAIWRNSTSAKGTLVETYLGTRGYMGDVPKTLRFHESLAYPGTTERYPGMVAAVAIAPTNEIVAIHRTFLTPNGSAKANVEQQKMMLGNCKGGAVRLAPVTDTLIVAEGIETTLSAMQLYGLPGWSGMTASGIAGMILPADVRRVIICADLDKPSAMHARGHGLESAYKAAARWQAEGRTVEVKTPPDGLKDFNDVLRMRVSGPSF